MKKRLGIVALLVVLLAGFAFAPAVSAQDDMVHVCDSSTILLLYIAEYEFGYTNADMDLASFEKGQYAPLFDMMMDSGEMMEEEMMEVDEATMAQVQAEVDGMVMSENLLPSGIEGEDEACTALRADLEKFVLSHYLMASMMMEEGQ
ncbi:MAG: hypothetical protein KJ064_27080 [Anaerolineae bacterium]|nr:hypothetical protein [Anaerolineae bacterium]